MRFPNMNLATFKARLRQPDTQVEVLAIDAMIYLVRIRYADGGRDREVMLRNPKGENWVFRSLTAVRQKLGDWQVREATLVQQSAYGEMVGSPGDQRDSELRLPLYLPAPTD